MPFGRRRAAHRSRESNARDPFDHLADERRAAEAEAWFLQPDDAPTLDVRAGVSSNITAEDLATPAQDGGSEGAPGGSRPDEGADRVDAPSHEDHT